MKILMNSPYYFINTEQLYDWWKIIDILYCFIKEGEVLLFKFDDEALKQRNESIQKYIKERTLFINTKWLLPWDAPKIFGSHRKTNWYEYKDKLDARNDKSHYELFEAVIVNRKKGFEDISYVFSHEEQLYYNGMEFDNYTLFFYEKKSDDFINKILPRLSGIMDIELINKG
jgi:hypothetical protein